MRVAKRSQQDLFRPLVARAQLHPAVRAKLEPLLRSLLIEAACVQPCQTAISANEQEGGDDQDHA
jgi:hypothetical protein